MRTQHNVNPQHLRPTPVETVDQRLREAFPEIDFDYIVANSTIFNDYNLKEKWNATVRSLQFWLDLMKQ